METHPGIDQTAAAMIQIEIGDDTGGFGCADRLTNLALGNNESAGKQEYRPTRHANSIIRHFLSECANAARMPNSMPAG